MLDYWVNGRSVLFWNDNSKVILDLKKKSMDTVDQWTGVMTRVPLGQGSTVHDRDPPAPHQKQLCLVNAVWINIIPP